MRKLFFLSLLITISCNNNDSESSPVDMGFIESFVNQDSEILIEPISKFNLDYEISSATSRGYIFEPMFDMEITDIGGIMAATGSYEIELFQLEGDSSYIRDLSPLFTFNISITKVGEFQFQSLNNALVLEANKRYLLKYFDENHDSVYDILVPEKYKGEFFVQPQKIGDLNLEYVYYAYHISSELTGGNEFVQEGVFSNNKLFLRGVPDFKYQIKK